MNIQLLRRINSADGSQQGFTLVELMITVVVLGIIASFAAPNMSLQFANMHIKSTTSTLENALKEAKAESTIRRQDIAVSYNNNGAADGSISVGSIRTYSYDAKSTIKDGASPLTFRPSKTASSSVTYTICDSNTSATSRQITVNKLAVISTKAGGSCP